jgi:hypothetical protein
MMLGTSHHQETDRCALPPDEWRWLSVKVAEMNKARVLKIKRGDACPECGEPMSRYALICRQCYKKSGGLGPRVHDEIFDGDENSDPGCQAAGLAYDVPSATLWYGIDALKHAREEDREG